MAEAVFARHFLTLLDARPLKLSSDHVQDPHSLPASSSYVLPRQPRPLSKRAPAQSSGGTSSAVGAGGVSAATGADGSAQGPSSSLTSLSAENTVTVTLKPLKGDVQTINGVNPRQTSIYEIKVKLGRRTGYAPDKIKVLHQRKPVTDSKTIVDATGGPTAAVVEFGVMYVGQPTQPIQEDAPVEDQVSVPIAATAAGPGPSGDDVIMKDASGPEAMFASAQFWTDLEAFVASKVGDKQKASEATLLWKTTWQQRHAAT